MLPENNMIYEQKKFIPSYTYNINRETNRVSGFIDGIEALRQTVFYILTTERYESLIYNWFYGSEFDDLIGKQWAYVESELKRRIREALKEDDRVVEITNLTIERSVNEANISFLVISTLGEFEANKVVKI